MRNMPDMNVDVDHENRSMVVINAAHHHALVKANRMLLWMVLALMAVVFVLGWLLLPSYSVNDAARSRQAISAMIDQNSGVSAEIKKLKGQMFGLVSGSIESKLRSLEDEIRRGSVSDSLNTIEDIKNDVKVLNTYNQDNGAASAPSATENATSNQQVMDQLIQLKDLIYLTFVSCGLMIAALAGIWLRNRYRLPHRPVRHIFWHKDRR
jgi:hypothetical protein